MGESPQTRETLFALREAIARIEGKPDHVARLAATAEPKTSDRAPDTHQQDLFDTLMGQMLTPGNLLEMRGQRLQQSGAVMGFGMALALMAMERDGAARQRLLFVADHHVVREAGLAYAPGLLDFGLSPLTLVHALPRRLEDALWLVEAALTSRAFSAILLGSTWQPQKIRPHREPAPEPEGPRHRWQAVGSAPGGRGRSVERPSSPGCRTRAGGGAASRRRVPAGRQHRVTRLSHHT